jgi:hypothetical protein
MGYNGWSTKSAWEVALYIDNTESVYKAAWFICEQYRQSDKTEDNLFDAAVALLDAVNVHLGEDFMDGKGGMDDLIEYIDAHEE